MKNVAMLTCYIDQVINLEAISCLYTNGQSTCHLTRLTPNGMAVKLASVYNKSKCRRGDVDTGYNINTPLEMKLMGLSLSSVTSAVLFVMMHASKP